MPVTQQLAAPEVVEVDEITLDGKRVRVRNALIPIDSVRLDPANPRIANTFAALIGSGQATESRIESLLWDDPDVRDLSRQIEINGGLIERIIVAEDGRAIEGNCRTVCYRKLHQKHPRDPLWRTIPARLLPSEIGAKDIAILLGEMHVAGKNTWSPFEKAGHVYRMHRDFSLTQDEIAQRLRMSKSKVNQLVRAFDVMKNKFLPKYPGHGNIRRFSYFEELYKNPILRDWLDRDAGAEDRFVEWVGKEKLSQGLHVRTLPAILKNERAVAALTRHGFAAAERVIAEDDPAAESRLFKRMTEMTEALRKAQLDDIRRVRGGSKAQAREIVMDMKNALDHFLELCDLDAE
jgi:hypothetical protein